MTEVRSTTDLSAAYAAARRAQQGWAATDPAERAAIFLDVQRMVIDRRNLIREVIRADTGKSLLHAGEEMLDAAGSILYYARHAPRLLRPQNRPGALPLLTRTREYAHPRGVVALITPWNYPFSLSADAVPALLAGNAVVHKPDSRTVASSLLLRDFAIEAGLDPDLWQSITGDPDEIGDALIDHADYVSFTGSTPAGRRIGQRCAERLIGCNLELGGKNPMLVLADADLDRAIPAALRACFSNAGQLCIGTERIYVERPLLTEFLARFVTETRLLRVGPDDADQVGALISAEHGERISRLVDRAVAGGATVLTGGRFAPGLGPRFYEPTVLTDVAQDAEINQQEVFGPVVTVTGFDGHDESDRDDEAVRLANDSAYGLNAAIFSRDLRRAQALAVRLQTGMVNINEGYASGYGSGAAIGGRKQSGQGRRHGAQGLLQYTESQTVATQHLFGFDPIAGVPAGRWTDVLAEGVRVMRLLRIR